MATPTENTLALTPPRRPTEDDFGGTAKENDAKYPPNPKTMPTAEDDNEIRRMLASVWRLVPIAAIPVTFVGGAPTVGTPQCGNPALTAATFTPNDNAAGDTTITWPAGTFPTATIPPMVVLNATSGNWLVPLAIPVTNGVQVRTPDSSATLADADFTLLVF